jgi:cytoskeletal protein RodZ
MWLFAILVGLGFVFMLYAFVQFFREAKRTTSTHPHSSNPKTENIQTGRVVSMDSTQSMRKHSFSKRHTAAWSYGNGEVQIRNTYSDDRVVLCRIRPNARRTFGTRGNQEVSQRQVEELRGATALSSNVAALQANSGKPRC